MKLTHIFLIIYEC